MPPESQTETTSETTGEVWLAEIPAATKTTGEGASSAGSETHGATTSPTNPTTTNDPNDLGPDELAALAVMMVNGVCAHVYRAPLDTAEQESLVKAFAPVVRKYGGGSVPCELVALGALALVMMPRELDRLSKTAEGEKVTDDRSGTRTEGERQEPHPENARSAAASELERILRPGT